ncbi:MAG: DUF4375 domain-containing protein [Verrucomicrobia bacterium]|nr:DUF4375 domain-containing protein [Verrucomicrobiota bacterium]
MKSRELSKAEADAAPYKIWNAFVNLLAKESYEDLDLIQQPAHLVFWYESEVQNGGHLQYFENRGASLVPETIAALGTLGAIVQRQILIDAFRLWSGRDRKTIATVEEFCATALEDEFYVFDTRICQCVPDLTHFLQKYLDLQRPSFVRIE